MNKILLGILLCMLFLAILNAETMEFRATKNYFKSVNVLDDPGYNLEITNTYWNYSSNELWIRGLAFVNATMSDISYFGVTFGANIQSNAHFYDRAIGSSNWIKRDSQFNYLSQKDINGTIRDHIYYINLGVLDPSFEREFVIKISGYTKQQILNKANSGEVAFYFGEGSSQWEVKGDAADNSIKIANADWDTKMHATTGDSFYTSSLKLGPEGDNLFRVGSVFDTSGLPDDATLTEFICSYKTQVTGDLSSLEVYLMMDSTNIHPNNPITLENFNISDYGSVVAGNQTVSDYGNDVWINFTFNQTGIDLIDLTGETTWMMMGHFSANDTSPEGALDYVTFYDSADAGSEPYCMASFTVVEPTIIVFDPKNITYSNKSLEMRMSADLTISTWTWQLDGNGTNSTTENDTLVIRLEGTHYLEAWADTAYNITYFTVDAVPPIVNTITPTNNTIDNDGILELTFNAEDSTGLQTCELWLNSSGTFQYYEDNATVLNNTNGVFISNATLNDGDYLWNVRCFDNISNSAFGEDKLLTVYKTGLDLSLWSAVNGTAITSWDVYMTNGTSIYSNDSLSNTQFISYKNAPLGVTNITFFKSGYVNVTFNYVLSTAVVTVVSGYTMPTSVGLFVITTPIMREYTGTTIALNVTSPAYINGTYEMYYYLDNATTPTSLCSGCTSESSILEVGYGNHTLRVNATSTYYLPYYQLSTNWSNYYAIYYIDIRDEKTDLPFDVSSSHANLSLSVICPTTALNYTITSNNQTIKPTCAVDSLKMSVEMGDDNYYRSLMPTISNGTVFFYLIDLDQYISYSTIFQMTDLANEYANAKLILEKLIGSTYQEIHVERFDIEDKVLTYLIRDETYRLSIDNDVTLRVLGNIIADSAGTKSIVLTEINFGPDDLLLFDKIRISATFLDNSTLRVAYSDGLNGTNYVRLWLFEESDLNTSVYYQQYDNISSIVFGWDGANINNTYLGKVEIWHSTFGNFTEQFIISAGGIDRVILDGISELWITIVSMFVLMCLGLIFTVRNSKIGVVFVGASALLLGFMGWYPVSIALTSAIIFIILLAVASRRGATT